MSIPGETGPSTIPNPVPDPGASLAQLRALEDQLYGEEVVAQVKQLPAADRQSFVASRLHLTALITKLDTQALADIREKLAAQSAALEQGVADLQASLARLEGAAGWATAINGVIGVLSQVVTLL